LRSLRLQKPLPLGRGSSLYLKLEVNWMLKIAFSGKANAGKDAAAKIFVEQFCDQLGQYKSKSTVQIVSFADPIKEMVRIMFPRTKRITLYGASKYRSTVIEGATLKGEPLTYRALLQNLGTEVGRGYKETIWLDVMDFKIEKAQKRGVNLFVINDLRFKNEFDYLKNIGFKIIRVVRDEQLTLDHISETEQNQIKNNEFNYIVDNNGTLDHMKKSIVKIVSKELSG